MSQCSYIDITEPQGQDRFALYNLKLNSGLLLTEMILKCAHFFQKFSYKLIVSAKRVSYNNLCSSTRCINLHFCIFAWVCACVCLCVRVCSIHVYRVVIHYVQRTHSQVRDFLHVRSKCISVNYFVSWNKVCCTLVILLSGSCLKCKQKVIFI